MVDAVTLRTLSLHITPSTSHTLPDSTQQTPPPSLCHCACWYSGQELCVPDAHVFSGVFAKSLVCYRCEKPQILITSGTYTILHTACRVRELLGSMAHPWMDESRPIYPGTVKEGYLVKSPPLDKKGVKVSEYRT